MKEETANEIGLSKKSRKE
ncbi:hypothetical protein [Clostridium frigoris]|nr:hypothetical protein [Clostridium frigoris]